MNIIWSVYEGINECNTKVHFKTLAGFILYHRSISTILITRRGLQSEPKTGNLIHTRTIVRLKGTAYQLIPIVQLIFGYLNVRVRRRLPDRRVTESRDFKGARIH